MESSTSAAASSESSSTTLAKKEEEEGKTKTINVRVVSQNGNEVQIKMKPTTEFRRMMKAYCERQGVSQSAVRFLFDGQRVGEEQTPKELGMESDDVIDVVLQQTGGTGPL